MTRIHSENHARLKEGYHIKKKTFLDDKVRIKYL